jgi:hypothetical protein
MTYVPALERMLLVVAAVLLCSTVAFGADDSSATQPAHHASSRPASRPVDATSSARAVRPSQASTVPPAGFAAEADPYAGLDHSGTPPLPPRENRVPARTVDPEQRSERSFYDGRPGDDVSAAEVLIWIPRTLFLPLHLALEYLVRRPLVYLTTRVEEHHLIEKVKGVFSFSDPRGGRGTYYPTFFWDFGTQITVGLLASYNNVLGSHHNLSASFAFWPESTGQVSVADSFTIFSDERGTVRIGADYVDRRDFRFFGLGPSSRQQDETLYRQQQLQTGVSLRTALAGLNRIEFGAFYRNAQPQPSSREPSLETVFDAANPAVVPGWDAIFHLIEFQTRLELDSRSPERVFTPGSGVRLDAFGSFAVSPHRPALNFFKWGAEAAGFWDLSGNNNVLAFRLFATALEATGSDPVPFSELVQLGGDEHLRGFSIGRFHGESALVATASYRYPIWLFLDADIFVGVGNVFDGRWERLHIKRMVMNWGLALRTNVSRITSFDMLLAFGTNRFEQWDDDFALDNLRVTVAFNRGF